MSLSYFLFSQRNGENDISIELIFKKFITVFNHYMLQNKLLSILNSGQKKSKQSNAADLEISKW